MEDNNLLKLAKEVSKKAYAPYSKFAVGACALFSSGKFYVGCNIENASYGLSLCAERNAISNAISLGEHSKLVKIAIFSPNAFMCFPCGACRQWIFEFSESNNTEILLLNKNNIIEKYKIEDLLPCAFKL